METNTGKVQEKSMNFVSPEKSGNHALSIDYLTLIVDILRTAVQCTLHFYCVFTRAVSGTGT